MRKDDQYGSAVDAEQLWQILAKKRRALTVDEVAEILTISKKTIYSMAKTGRIPSIRIGGAVRFDPAMIAQWLRDRTS